MIHFARKKPFPQAPPRYRRIPPKQPFSDYRSCKNIPTVKRPGTACVPPREHHDCLSTKKPPPTRLSSHSERQIGGWFQPHRLYLPRGGRQVAANRPGGPEPWYVCIRIDQRSQPLAGLDGGAPRSESKSNDCRGQSHIDFIVGSTPLHCSVYGGNSIHPHRL